MLKGFSGRFQRKSANYVTDSEVLRFSCDINKAIPEAAIFGSSNHRMITGIKTSFQKLQTICLIRLMSFPFMRGIILYPSTKFSH
ncbi:hypothetical protein HKD37_05G013402 [Glycine soja]